MNLSYGDHDMFKEMFETANSVKDREYKKIYLRVSQLDSPVLYPLPKSDHAAVKISDGDINDSNTELPDPIFNELPKRPPMYTAARNKLSSSFFGVTEDEDEDEDNYDRIEPTQNIPAQSTSLSPLER